MVWFSPERELLLPEIIALNGRWLRAVIAGDMIISGGQNVYPADIEAVVLAHEAVMPRNPNGKILKRELRTRFAELEF